MTVTDRIEVSPKIMMGKPVIRGTRVTVELILRKLGERGGRGRVFGRLSADQEGRHQGCDAYAADTLAHEETLLLKNQG